jgi:hypothetical protein
LSDNSDDDAQMLQNVQLKISQVAMLSQQVPTFIYYHFISIHHHDRTFFTSGGAARRKNSANRHGAKKQTCCSKAVNQIITVLCKRESVVFLASSRHKHAFYLENA